MPPQIPFRVVHGPLQPSGGKESRSSNEIRPYRFVELLLVNRVSGDLNVLDHFFERVRDVARGNSRKARLLTNQKLKSLLNRVAVVLLHKGFDGGGHGYLAQQLQLLSTQEFTHQGLYSEFRNPFSE